jgi:hypothetical protein
LAELAGTRTHVTGCILTIVAYSRLVAITYTHQRF